MAVKNTATIAKPAKAETVESPAPRASTITLKQIGIQLAQSHESPKLQVDALLPATSRKRFERILWARGCLSEKNSAQSVLDEAAASHIALAKAMRSRLPRATS